MMSFSVNSSRLSQSPSFPDLSLDFKVSGDGKTYINRQFSRYPFHVCRAQYMDEQPQGFATIYLQSSSGGIFESDSLCGEIIAGESAQAHITTQASTIVHSMRGGQAEQSTQIRAERNSYLEYLPDPLILFPEAHLNSKVKIERDQGSVVLFCDGFCRHDPQLSDSPFAQFHSEVLVEDLDGKTLCLDRYSIDGQEFISGVPGIMGKTGIQMTLLFLADVGQIEPLIDTLRDTLSAASDVYVGASRLPNNCGIVIRMIAEESFAAKRVINLCWVQVRTTLIGHPPSPRRK